MAFSLNSRGIAYLPDQGHIQSGGRWVDLPLDYKCYVLSVNKCLLSQLEPFCDAWKLGNALKSVFCRGSATDPTRVTHHAPLDSLQSIEEGKPIPNPVDALGATVQTRKPSAC